MNGVEYKVLISPEAEDDIDDLFVYIAYEVMHPLTALKYRDGIIATIDRLAIHAGIFAVSANEHLRRLYGVDVRTVIYKKMTIVYNIIGDIAYIRRVIPGGLIP
jgi:plasmid stabilization system protein ParE